MKQSTIYSQIYDLVAQIPPGKVTTYGDIARALGKPGLARVVGNALHRNPDPERIPCHRVVNGAGEVSNAFAFGGSDAQRAKLIHEGVGFQGERVNLGKYRWIPADRARIF